MEIFHDSLQNRNGIHNHHWQHDRVQQFKDYTLCEYKKLYCNTLNTSSHDPWQGHADWLFPQSSSVSFRKFGTCIEWYYTTALFTNMTFISRCCLLQWDVSLFLFSPNMRKKRGSSDWTANASWEVSGGAVGLVVVVGCPQGNSGDLDWLLILPQQCVMIGFLSWWKCNDELEKFVSCLDLFQVLVYRPWFIHCSDLLLKKPAKTGELLLVVVWPEPPLQPLFIHFAWSGWLIAVSERSMTSSHQCQLRAKKFLSSASSLSTLSIIKSMTLDNIGSQLTQRTRWRVGFSFKVAHIKVDTKKYCTITILSSSLDHVAAANHVYTYIMSLHHGESLAQHFRVASKITIPTHCSHQFRRWNGCGKWLLNDVMNSQEVVVNVEAEALWLVKRPRQRAYTGDVLLPMNDSSCCRNQPSLIP